MSARQRFFAHNVSIGCDGRTLTFSLVRIVVHLQHQCFPPEYRGHLAASDAATFEHTPHLFQGSFRSAVEGARFDVEGLGDLSKREAVAEAHLQNEAFVGCESAQGVVERGRDPIRNFPSFSVERELLRAVVPGPMLECRLALEPSRRVMGQAGGELDELGSGGRDLVVRDQELDGLFDGTTVSRYKCFQPNRCRAQLFRLRGRAPFPCSRFR